MNPVEKEAYSLAAQMEQRAIAAESQVVELQVWLDRLTWRPHGERRLCRHCNAEYPTHKVTCIAKRDW